MVTVGNASEHKLTDAKVHVLQTLISSGPEATPFPDFTKALMCSVSIKPRPFEHIFHPPERSRAACRCKVPLPDLYGHVGFGT